MAWHIRIGGTRLPPPPEYNVMLSWIAPTTNVDGSPIPASGPTSISYYRVEWGTYEDGDFGTLINSVRVSAPETTVQLNLPYGAYAFRVFAVNANGYESM